MATTKKDPQHTTDTIMLHRWYIALKVFLFFSPNLSSIGLAFLWQVACTLVQIFSMLKVVGFGAESHFLVHTISVHNDVK